MDLKGNSELLQRAAYFQLPKIEICSKHCADMDHSCACFRVGLLSLGPQGHLRPKTCEHASLETLENERSRQVVEFPFHSWQN